MLIPAAIIRFLVGEQGAATSLLDWDQIATFEFRYPSLLPVDSAGNYIPGPCLDIVIMDGANPHFIRAAGDCVCSCCRRPYREHPMWHGSKSWQDEPWLHELCNGLLVKL